MTNLKAGLSQRISNTGQCAGGYTFVHSREQEIVSRRYQGDHESGGLALPYQPASQEPCPNRDKQYQSQQLEFPERFQPKPTITGYYDLVLPKFLDDICGKVLGAAVP